jgi:hypothetical protein
MCSHSLVRSPFLTISKVVSDLRFSLNQPWKSADDCYIGLLKNTIKIYEYVDTFFSFSVSFNCLL